MARLCRQLELKLSEKKLDKAMQEMDKKVWTPPPPPPRVLRAGDVS